MKAIKIIAITLAALTLTSCSQTSVAITADTMLIDVRDAKQYAEGNLQGSMLMDLRSGDFEKRVASLDPDLTYAIYCATQDCADDATKIFTELGFKHVINLGSIGDAVNLTGLSISVL